MAKQRKADQWNNPQALTGKIHDLKVLLIEITLFILLIAVLLRILLHEAVPVFLEVSKQLPW